VSAFGKAINSSLSCLVRKRVPKIKFCLIILKIEDLRKYPLNIKRVSHIFLQPLLKTSRFDKPIQQVMVYMRVEKHAGFHVPSVFFVRFQPKVETTVQYFLNKFI